jgi:hypothetical protein
MLIADGAFTESSAHWEASQFSTVLALAFIVTLMSVGIVSVIASVIFSHDKMTLIRTIRAI